MERILSKDEIADLLSAVQDGDVDTGDELNEDLGSGHVSRLDLVQLPGPANWRLGNLDVVFDAFGRNAAISLANKLQRPINVEVADIESMSFEPSLMLIPQNSGIGVLSLDPFKTGGLLIYDNRMSYSLVEVLLGGNASSNVTPMNRPLTTIEMTLLEGVMADTCADLQKAFSPLVSMKSKLVKMENSTRMVNIVTSDAGVLIARFDVLVENSEGSMFLVIPHTSLEPIRDKLKDGVLSLSTHRDETWVRALQGGLVGLTAEVSAQMGEVALNVRDILNFQKGDVINLGFSPKTPVKILVEGKPKFTGTVGSCNGNRAVRITGPYTNGANDDKSGKS